MSGFEWRVHLCFAELTSNYTIHHTYHNVGVSPPSTRAGQGFALCFTFFSVRKFIIYLGGTYIPICMKWQGPHRNVYPSEDVYLTFTVTQILRASCNVAIPNHQDHMHGDIRLISPNTYCSHRVLYP